MSHSREVHSSFEMAYHVHAYMLSLLPFSGIFWNAQTVTLYMNLWQGLVVSAFEPSEK
jgi:hypothetical protein